MISLTELAKKGQEMRRLQSEYFKSGKCPITLGKCKKSEKEFDQMCSAVLGYKHPQPGNLFEQKSNNDGKGQ